MAILLLGKCFAVHPEYSAVSDGNGGDGHQPASDYRQEASSPTPFYAVYLPVDLNFPSYCRESWINSRHHNR